MGGAVTKHSPFRRPSLRDCEMPDAELCRNLLPMPKSTILGSAVGSWPSSTRFYLYISES